MAHYWGLLWDWNTLDSVRTIHHLLEGWALVFFALLVLFDVLAHLSEDKHRVKRFERIGLWFFGVAVFAEILAYPYSQRNDALASRQDADQRAKIAALDNSTQQLKTDAANAKAQVADADARARNAEAQVAVAKVASDAASAKAESFRFDIAKANERAAKATETAEADRLERVKMEQQLKARSLTEEQQQDIVASIKPFGGTPYEIAVSPTAEPLHLVEQIDGILHSAGWSPKESALSSLRFVITLPAGTKAEQTLSSGVSIQLAKALSEKYGKAVETLISALRMEGIPATGAYLPDSDGSPNNIHVVIGSQALIK